MQYCSARILALGKGIPSPFGLCIPHIFITYAKYESAKNFLEGRSREKEGRPWADDEKSLGFARLLKAPPAK